MDAALWTLYRCSLTYDFLFCLNFTLHEWRRPSLHSPKFQDQDQDQDSEVPKPRPRPRLRGFKTKTGTKTCKNGSRDISRPRLKSWELQVCNNMKTSERIALLKIKNHSWQINHIVWAFMILCFGNITMLVLLIVLKSAYIKCIKIFFGFSRRHSVSSTFHISWT